MSDFKHRIASVEDIPAIETLMHLSINELQRPFLSEEQIEASQEIMGLDTQLIKDGTYFIIEECGEIVGCGGWSKRMTLYGGNHTKGRDAALLNPKTDAARVRAMYTHPSHTRKGIGKLIIDLCEEAAIAQGYCRTSLMATLSGQPLYEKCGYIATERVDAETSRGTKVPLIKMDKTLSI